MDAALQTILEHLFTPGFAAGILLGAGILWAAAHRGWIVSADVANIKSENARLLAELENALQRIEHLTEELLPWKDFQDQIIKAALAERVPTDGN